MSITKKKKDSQKIQRCLIAFLEKILENHNLAGLPHYLIEINSTQFQIDLDKKKIQK